MAVRLTIQDRIHDRRGHRDRLLLEVRIVEPEVGQLRSRQKASQGDDSHPRAPKALQGDP